MYYFKYILSFIIIIFIIKLGAKAGFNEERISPDLCQLPVDTLKTICKTAKIIHKVGIQSKNDTTVKSAEPDSTIQPGFNWFGGYSIYPYNLKY